ncbi:MAG: hypothetical protein IJY66_01195 [Clostridia bacterium]|nr:hypothetical protein [Clostridia bacterium]
MKLFLYYAFCTVKNQIRKLFKTWVAILLVVCIAIGVVVGLIASSVDSMIEEELPPEDEEIVEDSGEELPPEEELPQMSEQQIKKIAEAVIAGLLLVMVVFEVLGAEKNGSNIFMMADVNLLFSSPMRPQSVLLFRLCCQMGAMIFLGIYLLLEVPMMIDAFGLSPLTAAVIVLSFALSILFGKLLNVLLYTLCSTHDALKKWLRPALYLAVGAIGGGYVISWQGSMVTPWEAAVDYLSAPWSRYVPVFGWIRAMIMLAWEDNLVGVALCALGLVVAMVAMVVIIRHIRADFYEDAMAHSAETAAVLQAAQEGSTIVKNRSKERSEKVRRDGVMRGSGANVFFFKTLYNRFRFAHLRVFTKTSETYLVTALGVVLLQRLVFHSDSFLAVALVLCGLVFFRALGNPLPQDVETHIFLMTPADPWAKMLWSLLGGALNCALDLLPAMLLATVLLGANPLAAIAWLLFAVSIDLYASVACTFITLSVPVSLSKQLQQVILILFIYFGLLPDIGLIVVGAATGFISLGALGAGVFNVLLSALLYSFSPLFLLRGRR